MAQSVLFINGPNLNLIGHREPEKYGSTTLADLEISLRSYCSTHAPEVHLSFFQSNHEGFILDRIHACKYPTLVHTSLADLLDQQIPPVDAIIINAGALTHTSVGLRDALSAVDIPFVEVHITNVHARENFRHSSYLSEKATAVICGLGVYGYQAALEFCIQHLKV